jgi:ligand-binding sensor domain-containing protein
VSALPDCCGRAALGGDDGEGLNLLDPQSGRFERFEHRSGDPRSLPSDAVHALYVDAAGSLWVGTHSGLSHLQPDGKSFETFTRATACPATSSTASASDRQGRLWLSTNNGLSASTRAPASS